MWREAKMNIRTAKDLAEHLSLKIEGEPNLELKGVAAPERAGKNDLMYVDSAKHLDRVLRSAAGCVITTAELRVAGKTMIFSEKPKLSFAKAAAWVTSEEAPAGVHLTAV